MKAFLALVLAVCLAVGLGVGLEAGLSGSSPQDAQVVSANASPALLLPRISGNNSDPLNRYQQEVKAHPNDIFALYDLGILYQLAENDCAKASVEYHRVLGLDPKYVPALFNLAICEQKTSALQAIELFKQVTALSPRYAAAYLDLGHAQLSIGQKAVGNENLHRAYQLEPAFKPA